MDLESAINVDTIYQFAILNYCDIYMCYTCFISCICIKLFSERNKAPRTQHYKKLYTTLLYTPGLDFMVFAFTMFGKFSFTSTYTGVFVFAAELYPTPLRNVGVGACNMLAGLGTMTSPYFGEPLVNNVKKCIKF